MACETICTFFYVFFFKIQKKHDFLRFFWVVAQVFPNSDLRCVFLTAKPIVLFFYSKTGFCPRTNISQPIWIKFCTHLLLYGIHLWADLDRDRRVGGSRPNQNDCFFPVILVTHPKSYIETTDRRNFGGKPSKWRRGRCIYAVVKNSGIL